jgi:hypothetical protein
MILEKVSYEKVGYKELVVNLYFSLEVILLLEFRLFLLVSSLIKHH